MPPSKKQPAAKGPAKKKRVYKKPLNEKHIIGFLFGIAFSITLFLGGLLLTLTLLDIPDVRSVAKYSPVQATTILDSKGRVISRIYVENRTVVSLGQLPDYIPQAFIAAEDSRFYDHPGLDLWSVFRAALNNAKSGRRGQGGSTITQQVAKSLLLTPEKTYIRKFKEAILAWRIDTLLTKDEVLHIYLNQIYLGSGAYGVEAAAWDYFRKPAVELNLGEAAILAGLPQAPSRYAPDKHLEAAKKRQRYVLNRMVADGYVSVSAARDAYEQPLHLANPASIKQGQVGHYVQLVRKQAEKILDMSLNRAGVRIYTTLDSALQERTITALRSGVLENFKGQKKVEGAALVMDGTNGAVLALTGGMDFTTSAFDRATQGNRSAGSLFKPLLYSTGFANGFTPATTLDDSPLSIKGSKGTIWRPKNFSGRFYGPTTLKEGLVYSRNIIAIKLLQRVGVEKVQKQAQAFGIRPPITDDLSLALGATGVSLLEITAAYAPFMAEGMYHEPHLIRRIERNDGEVIYQGKPDSRRVIDRHNATVMKKLLIDVIRVGTGKKAAGVAAPAGGKTGTTNENRDAWFVGFSGKYLAGVWIGKDDNSSLGKGKNGGNVAAPIWRKLMTDE